MSLALAPISIRAARTFVAIHHRHNPPPRGALFAIAATIDTTIIAVAIVGRPIARHLQDGRTCEVTRLCTTGAKNAASLLYAATRRAAIAMGYTRGITYTLATEPGTSLRAAGWDRVATVQPAKTWSRTHRPRYDTDLFGNPQRPTATKHRWQWTVTLQPRHTGDHHHATNLDRTPRPHPR